MPVIHGASNIFVRRTAMPISPSTGSGCERRTYTMDRCPTIRALLEPVENRPVKFYRGYDVFDQKNVGFVSDVPEENGYRYFLYDTTVPGNANTGHLYGIDLSPEQKEALVEYMKTL